MINNFKLIIVIASVAFITPLAYAQEEVIFDSHNYSNGSYKFYLYYDNGSLVSDHDFEFKYDNIPFILDNTPGEYRVDVITLLDDVATSTNFDPQSGNKNFIDGKIWVSAPYRADGKEARFYNGAGELLLTIDIVGSSFCDDDGVCEEIYGEDFENCGYDCKNTELSGVPGQNGQDSGNVPPESQGGSIIWIILGAGALAALLGYLIIWLRSRKQAPPASPTPTS